MLPSVPKPPPAPRAMNSPRMNTPVRAVPARQPAGSRSPFWQELSPINNDIRKMPQTPPSSRNENVNYSAPSPSPMRVSSFVTSQPLPSPGAALNLLPRSSASSSSAKDATGAKPGQNLGFGSTEEAQAADPHEYPNGFRPSALLLGCRTPTVSGAHLDRQPRSSINASRGRESRRDRILNFDQNANVPGLGSFQRSSTTQQPAEAKMMNTRQPTSNAFASSSSLGADRRTGKLAPGKGPVASLAAALNPADSLNGLAQIKNVKAAPELGRPADNNLGASLEVPAYNKGLKVPKESANHLRATSRASQMNQRQKAAIQRARVSGSQADILHVARTMIDRMQANYKSANPNKRLSTLLRENANNLQQHITALLKPKRGLVGASAVGNVVEQLVARTIKEAQAQAQREEVHTFSMPVPTLTVENPPPASRPKARKTGRGRGRGTKSQPKSRARDDQKLRACNCKKTRCLKLYCECFARQAYCSGCNCKNCQNVPEFEFERSKQVLVTLERDANAFFRGQKDGMVDSRTSKHLKGCNCKRSECLKKYCECFQAGVSCSGMCKCIHCKNNKASGSSRASTTHLVNGALKRVQGRKSRGTNPILRNGKRALVHKQHGHPSVNTRSQMAHQSLMTATGSSRGRNQPPLKRPRKSATTRDAHAAMTPTPPPLMNVDMSMGINAPAHGIHGAGVLGAFSTAAAFSGGGSTATSLIETERAMLQALDTPVNSIPSRAPVGLIPPGAPTLTSPQRETNLMVDAGTGGQKSSQAATSIPGKDVQDVMQMNMPLILFS
uniref:CRC domain-containing protein n=2 Tax=Lotharella globosa TaxID=91324 RepID=A0A7S3YC36_9EUKA|mmetsp:Transcript_25541/g.49970  ORF Transcript_25541/g.49970 Transcript_25541/m.49970 type:complete len:786 (-) Transcript_25541:473-2830(-)|eukprot:CAMPEP_0167781498 /NCGR_PEP_ID=MMETSP0111_2-20121227/5966_1 /TAXON_ID=91324 /ORGANISM="Lotharella globosa, Strain CCCM811" /LENGTH=785 /DNA_ID=CAMNT_0007672167 /DNA_START=121 /DNA_END=2478 /DNA_ORIENTATION=+